MSSHLGFEDSFKLNRLCDLLQSLIIFPPFTNPASLIARVRYENEACWMDPGYSNIFLSIPTIIVIILNIFFLCNVIKVLKSKLQFQSVATLPRCGSQDARAASVSGSGKYTTDRCLKYF